MVKEGKMTRADAVDAVMKNDVPSGLEKAWATWKVFGATRGVLLRHALFASYGHRMLTP